MGTSAEEAIARAKAIAARLAGTAAVSSTTASSAAAPIPAPPGGYAAYSASTTASSAGGAASAGGTSGGVVTVDAATAKAAEEALSMAFGPAPGSAAASTPAGTAAGASATATDASAPGSTTKRKRWGADEEGTTKKAAVDSTATASADTAGVSNGTADLAQQALLAAMQLPTSSSGAASSSSAAGAGDKITRKLPIPTAQYPNYNFVGLLIGPGGSKQRDLVQKAGGNVKISVRGDKNASGGAAGSEEGLYVLLEGTKECVDKADEMISELLKNPAKADEEKARQLGGLKGALGSGGGADGVGGGGVGGQQPAAGVDGQYGPSTGAGASGAGASGSGYTPKPVASILGLNTASGGHYGPTPGSTTIVEEKIGVPNGVVGYIIGRGGESIISMQRRSNCKVQIQKEFEMAPGSAQRVITLTADRRESIDMCRGIIEGMVKEKMVENGGGGMGGGMGGMGGNKAGLGMRQPGMDPQTAKLNQAIADGHHLIRVQVPNGDVGLIIGRGGSQIKTIQDRSGANVQIPQAADADNPTVRTISVTHPNQGGAEFARQLIEDILKEKAERQAGLGGMGGGGGGGGMGGGPPAAVGGISITVHIPDRDVGMCIGKSGSVIKAMQEKSGCRINIPAQPTPGLGYRICTVQGPPDKCQEVQGWIQRISAEQSSNFITAYGVPQLGVGGGQQYGGAQQYGGGQYQQQGRYGQQAAGAGAYGQQQGQQGGDQSAQWAAYYASQAAAGGGAAAAAAAAPAPTPAAAAPAPAGGEQPAADAYYDAFFRYAAYYGEEAARKYYGAWSPPPGTPNPYGNATLQAAAAAAASGAPAAAAAVPVAAPAAAPVAPAPGGAAKDSSVRRGVSNLPAWMTNK